MTWRYDEVAFHLTIPCQYEAAGPNEGDITCTDTHQGREQQRRLCDRHSDRRGSDRNHLQRSGCHHNSDWQRCDDHQQQQLGIRPLVAPYVASTSNPLPWLGLLVFRWLISPPEVFDGRSDLEQLDTARFWLANLDTGGQHRAESGVDNNLKLAPPPTNSNAKPDTTKQRSLLVEVHRPFLVVVCQIGLY
jgi:hypothetical protein